MRIFLFCWLLVLPASAQLRLFGTNTVVDFTAALRSGPGGSYSNYWLQGTVRGVEGKLLFVGVDTKTLRFVYSPDPGKLYGGPAEQLELIAGASLGGSTNSISMGEFMSLSPRMKQNFAPSRVYETVAIFNGPLDKKAKEEFESVGLLRGKIQVAGFGEGRAFDCGQVFTNAVTTNHLFFHATPGGLVRAKQP